MMGMLGRRSSTRRRRMWWAGVANWRMGLDRMLFSSVRVCRRRWKLQSRLFVGRLRSLVLPFQKELTFPANVLNRKSITYVGSNIYSRGEFQEVIDATADGRLNNLERMITARVPLEDGVEGAFEELIQSRDKHVKMLIKP